MMEQMRQDGVELDVYTYSGAITACGKGGKPTKALSLLDEMEQIGEKGPPPKAPRKQRRFFCPSGQKHNKTYVPLPLIYFSFEVSEDQGF